MGKLKHYADCLKTKIDNACDPENEWQENKKYVWSTIKDFLVTFLLFIGFITLFFKPSLIVIPANIDINTFLLIIELMEGGILAIWLFYVRQLVFKLIMARGFKLSVNIIMAIFIFISFGYFTISKCSVYSYGIQYIDKVHYWNISILKGSDKTDVKSGGELPFMHVCFKGSEVGDDNNEFMIEDLIPISSIEDVSEDLKSAYCLKTVDGANNSSINRRVDKFSLQFFVDRCGLFEKAKLVLESKSENGNCLKKFSMVLNKVHVSKVPPSSNNYVKFLSEITEGLYPREGIGYFVRQLFFNSSSLRAFTEFNKMLYNSDEESLLSVYKLKVQKSVINNIKENNKSNFYFVCKDEYIGNMGRDAIRKCFLVEKLQRNFVWIKIVDSILLVIIFIYTVRFADKIGNIIRGKGSRLKEVLVDFISCVIVLGLLGFIVGFLLSEVYSSISSKFELIILVVSLAIILIPCLFGMFVSDKYQKK